EKKALDVKPSLKFLGNYGAGIDPSNDPMVKEIEARTGYKVEYAILPQDKADEKLFLEMASSSDYDIVKLVPNQYYKLLNEGAFLPLDKLLDQYGPNIKAGILPESWKLSTTNGNIYAIPQKSERQNIQFSFAIRQDILDELKLPTPQTLDDFYMVLSVIKKNKPQMIPFSTCVAGSNALVDYMHTIVSAFGLYTEWIDVDGRLVHRSQMPQNKDYFQFIAKLYKEKLLDPDFPINKSTNVYEKFSSGQAAVVAYGWNIAQIVIPALEKNVPNAKVSIIPPLKGKDGKAGIDASLKMNFFTVIPKNSKHAADAIKYIDKKFSPDNFKYLVIGEEGVTFRMENRKYYPIMPAFNQRRNTGYWYLNGFDERTYPDMWLARVRRDVNLGKAYDAMNDAYFSSFAKQNPAAFVPSLPSLTRYASALKKLNEDYFVRFVVGAEKFESYDKYIETWRKSGGDEITREINDWYKTVK
ncbi:MAG: extracellular solute-binding protein, partial [Treponemataceae bacterium]